MKHMAVRSNTPALEAHSIMRVHELGFSLHSTFTLSALIVTCWIVAVFVRRLESHPEGFDVNVHISNGSTHPHLPVYTKILK